MTTTTQFETQTKALIDDLKSVCGNYGLGNDGNEFKIISQVFLYKLYFNINFLLKKIELLETKKKEVIKEREEKEITVATYGKNYNSKYFKIRGIDQARSRFK